ncbi:transglutaminase-like enzyme, predicted cysteine protease [Sphaerochaeta pleomorpha str. Grapes]|uniref:Transglutaminase-like enzyme, predicted cysteine protease n=1 Tax=Sphaerochaeta pleomorpha (strain ATCC BAA-1885 / DSM 22778 / Grapes) TaxID=158190 RepID=G8QWX0_SPHPG|nr:transglutaminase-like domain-containing protein [Sphaerochaeta pleomorpha]AEV29474.1 transglutaminase-like enzyme, predicted cysteine protease [Sphaerochaeta pleomorpha str. Grapes]
MESNQEETNTQSEYLSATELLDFNTESIQELIKEKGWKKIPTKTAIIGAIYTFVRDEIPFGYNTSLPMKASAILSEGYGQCITKTILLMALFRAMDIPCRYHAFTVDKIILRGILKGSGYSMAPKQLYHGWVEIKFRRTWIQLEGHIVDRPYILKLQSKFQNYMGSFYAYGLAVLNFKNPPINWEESHTYVQKRAIEQDFGIFNSPDEFFLEYQQAAKLTKKFCYRHFIQPNINKNIRAIREAE